MPAMKGRTLAVAIAATMFFLAPTANAQTTLRYQFKAGEKLDYQMMQKIKVTAKIQGQGATIEINQNYDLTWNVDKVLKDGNAVVGVKFNRVRMTMSGPGGLSFKYDSKSGEKPTGMIGKKMAPFFEAIVGLVMTQTMTPKGEIVKVDIPEKFTKAMEKISKDNPGIGGNMFSGKALKNMAKNSGLVLPEKAVTKGDTWSKMSQMKMPFGSMTMDFKNTYVGASKRDGVDLQKISMVADTKVNLDPKFPAKIQIKNNNTEGTAYFNNSTGRLADLEMVQSMSQVINAAGQEVTQDLQTTTTLRLKTK